MKNQGKVSMVRFANDLPNICSLIGLLCTVFALYFAINGYFIASIISILWTVLFDYFDGIIARMMKGRTKEQGDFGVQLDSMIDVVSYGVFPAVLLMSYGAYNLWFMPGAFIIVATSAIRLSYFNIYGLIDTKTYTGLSLDNNILILAFAFLFEGLFSHTGFSILLYSLLLILSAFNLSSIPMPKFGGKWVYALVFYVLLLSIVFGLRL